ncbi:phage baseplate assembly protein V [Cohnella faecalis]|uniref:Gp5/Type VI secretion system Vgr protein OB-fold domain-containing protein n=1 Tax=Cohnella faecalis TaxID=2315694 RepID=A0A398CRI1_9BACL|nr:phage baseplate assembly protein V [Cohnella faecalis]RIE02437.1 hypothetical protein D3H35_17180 [Cohnella faecalis]
MSDLVALLRQLIRAELSRHTPSHIGIVEAVKDHAGPEDSVNYSCDVRLRESNVVLGEVPMASPLLGSVSPPAVGDLVLVHFVGGNPDFPIIGGRLYSDALRPPKYAQGQSVLSLPPAAADGARIDMLLQGGTEGSRSLSIKLPDKISVTISDQTISLATDSLKLTLDSDGKKASIETGAASISADADGNVVVQGSSSVQIKTDGNLEIKSNGNLTLNAVGEVQIQGAAIKLN